MLMIVILSAVFILSFLLLFFWIRLDIKKETETEEKMNLFLIVLTALVLALILTGVAAFFLLIVLGSTSVINTVFTLDLSRKDLILMSIVYLLFIFTLDNVFEIIVKLFVKNMYLFYFLMLWLRIVAFYLIGSFFHLAHETNLAISGGVALIWTIIEVFYQLSQRKKRVE